MSDADIDALFQGDRRKEALPQREAVRQVAGRHLFVLTDGPGTGKTTTVLRMLLPLVRQYVQAHQQLPSIRISAPTGNAAQRLAESPREGVLRLRYGAPALSAEWHPPLAHVAAAEATILHRLLGSRGRHGGFRHHAQSPLPADMVVVDEASMVDLGLLRSLLEALPPHATLMLVGDADQLTSVGTGSVLQDLVGALEADQAPELVRLHPSFRADTVLIPINQAILQGNSEGFKAALQSAGHQATRQDMPTVEGLRKALGPWSQALYECQREGGAS